MRKFMSTRVSGPRRREIPTSTVGNTCIVVLAFLLGAVDSRSRPGRQFLLPARMGPKEGEGLQNYKLVYNDSIGWRN